ncbi:MAG: hypothetical protein ACPLRO_09640, partial [Candidatus Kapaibacteriota bacterium]
MKLSEDTNQVLEFLDYTSGGTLRKRKDLGALLEALAGNNNYTLANELIFYGAALWGGYRILKTNTSNEATKLEIEKLFEKVLELLTMTIELFDE